MAIQIMTVGAPVIFTNNAGGGPNEIQAPERSEASMQLNAGGGTVREAWYTGFDHLADLPAIHRINCTPDGHHVKLTVAGTVGHRDARVRINVYAAVEV